MCPAGQVVNGTLSNGTFVCTTVAGGAGGNPFDQVLNISSNVTHDVMKAHQYIWNYTSVSTSAGFSGNQNFTIENLTYFKFTNATGNVNFTIYNTSLYLNLGLNNLSAIGENAALFVDTSKKSYNGTCALTRCPTFTTNGKYDGAYVFDGDNDTIVITDTSLAFDRDSMTYAFWVNHTGSGVSQVIVQHVSNDLSDSQGSISINASDYLTTNIYESGTITDNLFSPTTLSRGVWHLVIISINQAADVRKMYIDGVQVANDTVTGSGNYPYTKAHIGASRVYTAGFNGTIDQSMLWNRVLSADEISMLYSTTIQKYSPTVWNARNTVSGGEVCYQNASQAEVCTSAGAPVVTTALGQIKLNTTGYHAVNGNDAYTNFTALNLFGNNMCYNNQANTFTGNQKIIGSLNVTQEVRAQQLYVTNATNNGMDRCTLVSGVCTIANTRVTANTNIFCFEQTQGGTVGSIGISGRNAAVNYTVTSSNILDTSVVACLLVEPS